MTARAHPRVCGENLGLGSRRHRYSGSSPRVRGKQRRPGIPDLRRRLIPACAGKTEAIFPTSRLLPAHPRVCGENTFPRLMSASPSGSSPRVRGKRFTSMSSPPPAGLIPACAGKTANRERGGDRRPAHPRVCGENRVTVMSDGSNEGSSPRVRGKP